MKYLKDSEFAFSLSKLLILELRRQVATQKSFHGLAGVITLGLNSPVMITQNIDVRANLAN